MRVTPRTPKGNLINIFTRGVDDVKDSWWEWTVTLYDKACKKASLTKIVNATQNNILHESNSAEKSTAIAAWTIEPTKCAASMRYSLVTDAKNIGADKFIKAKVENVASGTTFTIPKAATGSAAAQMEIKALDYEAASIGAAKLQFQIITYAKTCNPPTSSDVTV